MRLTGSKDRGGLVVRATSEVDTAEVGLDSSRFRSKGAILVLLRSSYRSAEDCCVRHK